MNTTTLPKITKAHLYFHATLARVERIVGVSASGDVLHRHHAESNVSRAEAFRLATREEVKAYLGKIDERLDQLEKWALELRRQAGRK